MNWIDHYPENKNVIELIKYKLGGRIIIKFVELKPKTYSYLTYNASVDQKAITTKKMVIKRKIKLKITKFVWKIMK